MRYSGRSHRLQQWERQKTNGFGGQHFQVSRKWWYIELVSVSIVSTYEILPRYPCALLQHTFAFPGCLPMCINDTTLAMGRPFESATRLPFHVSTFLHMKNYLGIYVHYCDTRVPFQVVLGIYIGRYIKYNTHCGAICLPFHVRVCLSMFPRFYIQNTT